MELLSQEQAAIYLGVAASTLETWRSRKTYPLRFVKVGGRVRYRKEHLEEFLNLRTCNGDGSEGKPKRKRK